MMWIGRVAALALSPNRPPGRTPGRDVTCGPVAAGADVAASPQP